jgi:hypothetical protein
LGRGPKKFEAKWLLEKNFREIVQQAWEQAQGEEPDGCVLNKLGRVHDALHDWDKKVLNQPKKRLRKAQRDFETAVSSAITDESEAKAKEMADLIEMLLEQEEISWLQRSIANWLQHGDRNTTFFHNFATARRKKNFIKKLKNEANAWVEVTDMLKPIVFNYFSNLFSSEVQATDPALLKKIVPRVSEAMNTNLKEQYTAEEVKKAAFTIGDFKARMVFMQCFIIVFGMYLERKLLQKFFRLLIRVQFLKVGTTPL